MMDMTVCESEQQKRFLVYKQASERPNLVMVLLRGYYRVSERLTSSFLIRATLTSFIAQAYRCVCYVIPFDLFLLQNA